MVYPWKHTKRYNDYSSHCKKIFNERIQKISVNAGFSCPNRDGTKGNGGCIYCDNNTFNPFYCSPEKSVTQQLDEGIAFFSEKYKAQKYLAYFQAYTNTYAPLSRLKEIYEEALSHADVIGLAISTRPDCIDEEKLDYLEELNKKYYIVVEYGVESCNNDTLKKINRCHSFEDSVKAIELTASKGIHTGIHMIAGLPGETKDMIINHARTISALPIETLKIHQLQIIKGTKLSEIYLKDPESIKVFSVDEYIDLMVEFLENLNPAIVVERFTSESPAESIIAPKWGGLKNFEITARIEKMLERKNTWQRKYWT